VSLAEIEVLHTLVDLFTKHLRWLSVVLTANNDVGDQGDVSAYGKRALSTLQTAAAVILAPAFPSVTWIIEYLPPGYHQTDSCDTLLELQGPDSFVRCHLQRNQKHERRL
jgi:hypothetical protein